MKVQICGKISGLTPAEYWSNFASVEAAVKKKFPNIVVINPMELCKHITEAHREIDGEATWRHYMDVCLASIKHVDGLVVMKNASDSAGALEEMKRAYDLGKVLYDVDGFLEGDLSA